ncbi:MAG: cellobiose-specific phosphotransferase system component IIA [Planctomycetota bacterium]|jgi:cellobiose-specific phosphotransferase system component IIA
MTAMEFQFRHKLAAHALSQGDALAALNALTGDNQAHSRALRGIALAQIEEFDEAQSELRAAAEAFTEAPNFRARALAALAEIAAARREVGTALEDLLVVALELDEL